MSGDIKKFLKDQKSIIFEEKKRLGLLNQEKLEGNDCEVVVCDNEEKRNSNQLQSDEDKENTVINNNNNNNNSNPSVLLSADNNQNLPFIENIKALNKNSNEATLEEKKRLFVDNLANSEGPFSERSNASGSVSGGGGRVAMLRYGEYSPNNPQLRGAAGGAAPYLGLGEYEQRRNLFLQRQKADYLRHLAKKNESIKEVSKGLVSDNKPKSSDRALTKSVQTEIQNIECQLVQYDLRSENSPEKELSPRQGVGYFSGHSSAYRVDQRLTSAQNALLNHGMDKPKSILSNRRTGSPRERYSADMHHSSSYTPSFMDGFSYSDRSEDVEREKLKRDSYQRELRLQIEEKRRLQAMREDQERRERELENRRLEQQLLRMQEEQSVEEARRSRRDEQMRRHSEDLMRRKQELQSSRHQSSWRKHTESESGLSAGRAYTSAADVSSRSLSSSAHYSPPVARRHPYSFNVPSTSVFADPASRYNPSRYESSSYHSRKDAMNRMDSLNAYDTVPGRHRHFSRFDSLSRIDSLNQRIESMNIRDSLSDTQRRHSATHQDLTVLRKSPRLRRRSSSSRFEDSLPIPVLKAHSPVAKELKNSVPFSSSGRHSSDALRKLEDKWQIPAVQKNIVNNYSDAAQSRSILTQLGAIRMQLQQEQLRMDESLRKRGITQSKAVDFH